MLDSKRLKVYLRQTGAQVVTPRQARRLNKKVCRDLYKYIRPCGHNAKKCDCPW